LISSREVLPSAMAEQRVQEHHREEKVEKKKCQVRMALSSVNGVHQGG
jgi:hypothetical protein